MTIDVYYIHLQKNKRLILFVNNKEDFNFLNKLLLFSQQLGNKSDEDVVPLTIIESLESQFKITISSDFLFVKMKKFSGTFNESVVDLLRANGIKLIPKLQIDSMQPQLEQSSINKFFSWCCFGFYKKHITDAEYSTETSRLLQGESILTDLSNVPNNYLHTNKKYI